MAESRKLRELQVGDRIRLEWPPGSARVTRLRPSKRTVYNVKGIETGKVDAMLVEFEILTGSWMGRNEYAVEDADATVWLA